MPPRPSEIPPAPPSIPGTKPRLVEKLAKTETQNLIKEMLELMEEVKGDDDVQDELKYTVMDAVMGVYTLWIGTKSMAEVRLGHLPFKYTSSARKVDPYHLHTIIFLGDRTPRGDPMP